MRSNYLKLPDINQKIKQRNQALSIDKLESEQEIPYQNEEQIKAKKLQKLKETKEKVRNTVNKLKEMNEAKLDKVKAKLFIAEKMQKEKEQEFERRIKLKEELFKQRKEQEHINNFKKQQQDSIKNLFENKRNQSNLEKEIQGFKNQFKKVHQPNLTMLLNKSSDKLDNSPNSSPKYSKTVGGIQVFAPPPQQPYEDSIMLTQPVIIEKTPSQRQLSNQQKQRNKKQSFRFVDKSEDPNPFNQKENWQLVFDAKQKGESQVEWPGIGIKKTPIYELKQIEKEKNRKKLDLLKRINRGDFLNIKHNRINFESVYKNVKEVYKIVSDNPDQLLIDSEARKESFMDKNLQKTIKNAQKFWNGKQARQMQKSGSLPNLDKYEEFLEENIDQPLKKKYMFTKLSNVKVKLA